MPARNKPTKNAVKKIRVAIIGIGNCSSSFVQGVEYYRHARPDADIPGLMPPLFGEYYLRDIELSAAFDVDANKVGKDVAEAIYAGPNNTSVFCEAPPSGVKFARGITHDGVAKHTAPLVHKAPGATADVVGIPQETLTMSGALVAPSSYLMKSPPQQLPDDRAHQMVEEFIRG